MEAQKAIQAIHGECRLRVILEATIHPELVSHSEKPRNELLVLPHLAHTGKGIEPAQTFC